MEFFKKITLMHDITTIQETHGNQHDEETLRHELPLYHHHLSTIPDRHVGGILLSIKKEFIESYFLNYSVVELINGRMLKLDAQGDQGRLVVIAII